MIKIIYGDNIKVLKSIQDNTIDFIYIDPPFNTGVKQKLPRQKTINGEKQILSEYSYQDTNVEFFQWIKLRFEQAYRVLRNNGSFLCHMDWHEVHYCKILLDKIFGRKNFVNEIIWAYDYGAKQKNKWPTKHDNILFYAKDSENYIFNYDAMWRLPYMAPGLAGKEKAEKGKVCTDVIWHTICPTKGTERIGYPTQKPVKLIKKLIEVHTNPGALCLDFFAGSGTTGEACQELGRSCICVDNNEEAIEIMKKRFEAYENVVVEKI